MASDWTDYDQDIERLYHPENFEYSDDEFEFEEGGEDNE